MNGPPAEVEIEDPVIPPAIQSERRWLWPVLGLLLMAGISLLWFVDLAGEPDSAEKADEVRFAIAGRAPVLPDPPVPPPEDAAPEVVLAVVEPPQDDRWERYSIPSKVMRAAARSHPEPLPDSSAEDLMRDFIRAEQSPPPRRDPNQGFLEQTQSQSFTVSYAQPLDYAHRAILQRTLIPATLETAVQSGLPGGVSAIVARDVYAAQGDRVLLPWGTRLHGQVNPANDLGQRRVFVVWERAVTPGPNPLSVNLNSLSTGPLGRGGLPAFADHHFWERFACLWVRHTIEYQGQAMADF